MRNIHDGNACVFGKCITELLHKRIKHLVQRLVKIKSSSACPVVFRCTDNRGDHAIFDVRRTLRNGNTGGLFDECIELAVMLFFDLVVMHIPIPFRAFMNSVFGSERIGKIGDNARFLERLVIDRNQSHTDGFETFVDIDSERDALYCGGFLFKFGNVLFHLSKTGFMVQLVNEIPESQKSLRFNSCIGKADLHGFHALNIVVKLIEPMQKMPQTEFFLRLLVDAAETPNEFKLIKKLCHTLSQIKMMQYIHKNLLSIYGNSRIGSHIGDDTHDEILLFFVVREITADGIKTEVMTGSFRQLLVFRIFVVWKQYAESFVFVHIATPRADLRILYHV